MANQNTAQVTVEARFDTKQVDQAVKGLQRTVSQFNSNPIVAKNFTQPLGRITGSADEFTKSLEASNARVVAFGASAGAIFAIERAMSQLVTTTIEVEQAFTNIRALTNSSNRDFKKLGDGLFNVAKNTGLAFKDVADSAEEFARQGLGVTETLKRTNAALALSRLGAMDAVNATESLTAALNTFGSSVSDATVVVNKLAQVDAEFAVSSGDLAEAIKRTGSSALGAKVSFEELLAVVTVAQERTARGGAVIGNSFKTIFTRIQRPEVLNQLELIGVKVRNANDEILPAIQILRQYARVYDTLTPALKSNTAELLAGVFQVNVLKSVLPELANETGKFDSALKTANETTNEATNRLKLLTNTTKGTLNETVTNLQQTASEIGKLTIKPAIDNILKTLSDISGFVRPDDFLGLGENIGKGVYEGIGKVISGPGIVLLGAVLGKIGVNLFKFVKDAGQTFLGLNRSAQQQALLQGNIQQYLIERPEQLSKILSKEKSINSVAQDYTNELRLQQRLYKELIDTSGVLVQNQKIIGTAFGGKGSSGKSGRAFGLIPNFVPNFAADADSERNAAASGGYQAGSVRRMNVAGIGRVTYNGNEEVKRFSGFEQPAIMPPALSQAGKQYRQTFKQRLGFDPYNEKALGFIPNFNFQPQAAIKLPSGGTFKAASSLTRAIKGNKVTLTKEDKDHLNDIGYTAHISGRKKQADAKAQRQKAADKIETYPVPINGRIGMLALNAESAKRDVTISLRRIPALKQFIDQNPELNNDKVSFTGFDVKTLGDGFGKSAKQADEFFDQMSVQLASPLAALAAGFSKKILNNDGIDRTRQNELADALRGKDYLSPSMEGEIFEQVARLVTSDPKYLANAFDGNTDFQAPFDFEEIGKATPTFKKTFGFKRSLLKADAKRTASGRQIDSLVKKSFNQAILSPNDLGSIFGQGGDLALPLVGGKIRGKRFQDKDLKAAQAKVKSDLGLASGFVPNFSMDAISKAIQREDRAGVRRDKVRVGYDARLKKSGGIGVYNTDEGSLANAIDMHLASGRNMTALQTQGKAQGFIPNFAASITPLLDQLSGSKNTPILSGFVDQVNKAESSIKNQTKTIDANTEKTNQSTKARGDGLVSLFALTALGGQLQSFGQQAKESESALGVFGGVLGNLSGQALTWGYTTQTVFSIIGIEGDSLKDQLVNLKNKIVESASAVGGFKAVLLGATRAGKARTFSDISADFTTGRNIAQTNYRGGGAIGRAQRGFRGGLANVARGGGAIGALAKGIGALANPVGLVTVAVGGLAAGFFAVAKAAENTKLNELERDIDETNRIFKNMGDALDSLSQKSNDYIKALKEEAKQKELDAKRREIAEVIEEADIKTLIKEGGGIQAEGVGGKTRTFTDADEVLAILTDATASPELRENLLKEIQERGNAVVASRKFSSELTKLGIQLKRDNKFDQQRTEAAAAAFKRMIEEAGKSSEELLKFQSTLTDLSNRVLRQTTFEGPIGFVPQISARNFDKLNKEAIALFQSLAKSSTEREELGRALDSSNKSLRDEEDFLKSLNEILQAGLQTATNETRKSLNIDKTLRDTQKQQQDQQDAAERLIKEQRESIKALDAYNKGLIDQQRILNRNLALLNSTTKFESERLRIIEDANFKTLAVLRSQFTVSDKKLSSDLNQNSLKFSQERIKQQNKSESELLSISKDFFAKQLEAATKDQPALAGALENNLQPIVEGFNNAVQAGLSGQELIDEFQRLRDQFAGSSVLDGKESKQVESLLDSLAISIQDPAFKLRDALDVLAQEEKNSAALIRERNVQLQKEILFNQKLQFARGAETSPRSFISGIQQARTDVFFGRRENDPDRATTGLVELAKTFSGFSLGGVNPGEKFLRQVTDQFAKNLETVVAQEIDGPVTEGMRKEIREVAKLRAEEAIKPNKPLEDNTAATKANTAALLGIARAQGLNMAGGGDMAGASGRGTGPASGGRNYSRSGPNAGARMNARGAYSDAPRSAGTNSPLIGPGISERPTPRMLPNVPPIMGNDPNSKLNPKAIEILQGGLEQRFRDGLSAEEFLREFQDRSGRNLEEEKGLFEDLLKRFPNRQDLRDELNEAMGRDIEQDINFKPLITSKPISDLQHMAKEATTRGTLFVKDEEARKLLANAEKYQRDLNTKLTNALAKASGSLLTPEISRLIDKQNRFRTQSGAPALTSEESAVLENWRKATKEFTEQIQAANRELEASLQRIRNTGFNFAQPAAVPLSGPNPTASTLIKSGPSTAALGTSAIGATTPPMQQGATGFNPPFRTGFSPFTPSEERAKTVTVPATVNEAYGVTAPPERASEVATALTEAETRLADFNEAIRFYSTQVETAKRQTEEGLVVSMSKLVQESIANTAQTDKQANQYRNLYREAEALTKIYQITIPNEERRTEAIRQLNVELANNVKFLDAQINFQRKQTDFANNQIGLQELQAAAQNKLDNSYHDAEKSAEALNEAIGTRFRYNANQARRDYSDLVLSSVDTFKSGVKGAFSEAIKGTSDLREAFKKVFDNVLNNITDKATSNFVDAAFGAIGNRFGKKDGGLIQKFARGGMVAGGSGVKDDVPAFLQSGEYVIRKSSVNKYGSDFLDTINRGGISQFQNGGRAFNQTLRNEFSYASGRPTSGSFNRDSRLSAFAIMDSNNPMAQLALERQQIFDQYQIEFAAYEEQKKAAMRAFKKQQKSTIVQGFINMGLQMAANALAQGAGEAGGDFGKTGDLSGTSAAAHTPPSAQQITNINQAYSKMSPARIARQGMTQVQVRRANGGLIKAFARGGMNRDNVPALLMGGEYVINKQSVDKYGVNFFDGINKGRLPRFQEGGAVGMAESAGGGSPLNNTNNFSININIDQSGTASVSNDPTDQGASQNTQAAEEEQERNKRLGERIQTVVQAEIVDQLRPGGLLYNEKRV